MIINDKLTNVIEILNNTFIVKWIDRKGTKIIDYTNSINFPIPFPYYETMYDTISTALLNFLESLLSVILLYVKVDFDD